MRLGAVRGAVVGEGSSAELAETLAILRSGPGPRNGRVFELPAQLGGPGAFTPKGY